MRGKFTKSSFGIMAELDLTTLTLAESEISRTIVCDSDDQTSEEVIGRNSPGAY